jgi:hypothetical protein
MDEASTRASSQTVIGLDMYTPARIRAFFRHRRRAAYAMIGT